MSISNNGEQFLLKKLKEKTLYIKLHLGDPGENCTANVAAEKKRKKVEFLEPTEEGMRNSKAVEWENVSTEEEYKYISLWDAEGDGEGSAYWSGALDAELIEKIKAGNNYRIGIEELLLTLD